MTGAREKGLYICMSECPISIVRERKGGGGLVGQVHERWGCIFVPLQ